MFFVRDLWRERVLLSAIVSGLVIYIEFIIKSLTALFTHASKQHSDSDSDFYDENVVVKTKRLIRMACNYRVRDEHSSLSLDGDTQKMLF
jgi:hypothetical protein